MIQKLNDLGYTPENIWNNNVPKKVSYNSVEDLKELINSSTNITKLKQSIASTESLDVKVIIKHEDSYLAGNGNELHIIIMVEDKFYIATSDYSSYSSEVDFTNWRELTPQSI